MELIALNLGYDLHILSRSVFSMLVLMALVTTVMTGPLLSLFGQIGRRSRGPSMNRPSDWGSCLPRPVGPICARWRRGT